MDEQSEAPAAEPEPAAADATSTSLPNVTESHEESNSVCVEEPPRKVRKPEVFLRAEQIPYLYESLRGKDVEPPAENSILFSDPICEEYLQFVARTGRPLFDWKVLKSFFLWKLECVMLEVEQAAPFDYRSAIANTDRSSPREYVERILSAFILLPGVPFTIQRICELLIQPRNHYKRADKFYRALEKNVTVVTTVDLDGTRETDRQPEIMDQEVPSVDVVTQNSDTPEAETTCNHAETTCNNAETTSNDAETAETTCNDAE